MDWTKIVAEKVTIGIQLWSANKSLCNVYKPVAINPKALPNVENNIRTLLPSRSTKNVAKMFANNCTIPTTIDEWLGDSFDPASLKMAVT